jgi:hypothetical protein
MRTLICPDIHGEIDRVAALVEREQFDLFVPLGDWFDWPGSGASGTRRVAAYLRALLEDRRVLPLLGNHEAQYFYWRAEEILSNSYSRSKRDAVTGILKPITSYRARFRLFCDLDGWLISHAGLSRPLLPAGLPASREAIVAWLEEESRATLSGLAAGYARPLAAVGADRGGFQPSGGLLWADFDSLQPVPGLRQIVGHTWAPEVREKGGAESRTVCLDTRRHYAVLSGGGLSIHQM